MTSPSKVNQLPTILETDSLSHFSIKNVKRLLVPASKILNAESLGFGLLVGPKINWLISENENNH